MQYSSGGDAIGDDESIPPQPSPTVPVPVAAQSIDEGGKSSWGQQSQLEQLGPPEALAQAEASNGTTNVELVPAYNVIANREIDRRRPEN